MKKTLHVVAAIIVCHGKILCMQKGQSKYSYTSHHYEFPGGKIEENETKIQALLRECQEELNVTLPVHERDFFMELCHEYPDFRVVVTFYLCRVPSFVFTPKEHIRYGWYFPAQIHKLPWLEANLPLIEKLSKMDITSDI